MYIGVCMYKRNVNKCNKVYIYIFNLYMQIYGCMYGFIWLYIPIYAAFRCPTGAQDILHSHLGSLVVLHQAATAMAQCYPTSMQRAAAPAQLPCHMVIQLNKNRYK